MVLSSQIWWSYRLPSNFPQNAQKEKQEEILRQTIPWKTAQQHFLRVWRSVKRRIVWFYSPVKRVDGRTLIAVQGNKTSCNLWWPRFRWSPGRAIEHSLGERSREKGLWSNLWGTSQERGQVARYCLTLQPFPVPQVLLPPICPLSTDARYQLFGHSILWLPLHQHINQLNFARSHLDWAYWWSLNPQPRLDRRHLYPCVEPNRPQTTFHYKVWSKSRKLYAEPSCLGFCKPSKILHTSPTPGQQVREWRPRDSQPRTSGLLARHWQQEAEAFRN